MKKKDEIKIFLKCWPEVYRFKNNTKKIYVLRASAKGAPRGYNNPREYDFFLNFEREG